MLIKQHNIVDGNIYAYLLIDAKTYEILDGNKLSKTFFNFSEDCSRADTLFQNTQEGESLKSLMDGLSLYDSCQRKNIISVNASGERFLCHIELCKVSEMLIFLVLKEYCHAKDTEMEEIIEIFDNPIFALDHNDQLTTTYGNTRCCQCIRMQKEDFSCNSTFSFLSVLQNDKTIGFLQSVNHQLDLYAECDIDIEVSIDHGFYQLFRFNAFKSVYDGKLYGVLISAKRQSELMKKIEYDQQYFDIMQQFTKDLLFRIDIASRTLVHRGDISKFIDLLPEMSNFPESMRKTRLIHPDDLEGYIAYIYRLMNGESGSFDVKFQFENGSFEKYRLQASPLFDKDGVAVQVVGKSENIQKYVDIETRANYDALTTALNKQSFCDLMGSYLERAVASDRFALLFLDLDNFKSVNDTMGHVFGDFLLEATSKRIMNCIRSQDRLGRVGGDEFVIFFQFAPSNEAIQERAEAILHSLRRDFTQGSQRCKVKASIGIALFPEHGTTYEDLYHRADQALYESKARGKDVATIYHPSFDKKEQ